MSGATIQKRKRKNGRELQIVFAVLSTVFYAVSIAENVFLGLKYIPYFREYTNLTYIIPELIIFAGLILFINKNNPLPSIGLIVLAVRSAVIIVLNVMKGGFYIVIIGELLMITGYVLLALMLLTKKQQKAWFLPAVFITAFCVFNMILNRGNYDYGLFIDLNDFIWYSYPFFAEIIAVVFMCLLSKYQSSQSDQSGD